MKKMNLIHIFKGILKLPVRFLKTACGIMMIFMMSSCEPGNFNLSCENCFEIKPTEGLLSIRLSPFNENDSIAVTVFKGKLESGTVFLQDTVSGTGLDVWVPIDYFYTVQAEYRIDTLIIRAIDGDRVSVYLDQTNCSVACWRPRDGTADCRLR